MICLIPDCDREPQDRGLCRMHYTKLRRLWRDGYILQSEVLNKGWMLPIVKACDMPDDKSYLTRDTKHFVESLGLTIQQDRHVHPYSTEAFEGRARVLRAVTTDRDWRTLPFNMRYEGGAVIVFNQSTGETISRYTITIQKES